MAKTKEEKQQLLDEYREILAQKPSYILVDTNKVSMPIITELKKALAESNSSFKAIKNTLFKIAAQEADQPTKIQELEDSTGVIVVGEEPTAPAKALRKIQKEHSVFETKFAFLFGEIAEKEDVDMLAEIPSREELLAKLVGSMSSSISGFMNTVTGNVRQFTQAVSEIQKSKEN